MKTINWRIPAAFLLAPILPCALYAAIHSAMTGQWSGILIFTALMVAVSLVLSLVIGLPAYLLLRRFWKVRFVECLAAGAGTALVLNLDVVPRLVRAAAFSGGGYAADDIYRPLLGLVAQMILGAAIGLCFWVIGI